MSPQQKTAFIKKIAKELNLASYEDAKLLIDSYELLFIVEQDIEKMIEPKTEKTICKIFAKHFMIYLAANLSDKKSRLIKIC